MEFDSSKINHKNSYGDHLSSYFESIQQSERIGSNLRVFVDEKIMNDRALDVGMLQDHIDTVRDTSLLRADRRIVGCQVMDYLNDPASPVESTDVEYMFALWGDLPEIDATATNYRNRLEQYGTEQSQLVIDKLDDQVAITEDDWHDIRIGVDVPEIVKLSQHVNIESIIARSSISLDRVATATKYDHAVLKDILQIETVYAPLLDLLGLHASESLLKHHTEKARLMATGREDVVQAYKEASAYIESVRESRLVDAVIADVIGIDVETSLDPDKKPPYVIDNEETPYGSKSYFSAINFLDEKGIPARFISRIKSPGSYTHKKLHKYDGAEPQDVYAGTVVVDSIEEMASIFRDVHENIRQLDSCEFSIAKSKYEAVNIKGKRGYIKELKHCLGEDFEDGIHEEEVEEEVAEPFQGLKVTFTITNGNTIVPVEIQFQTRDDRNRSRLGGASHLCFKGKNGKGLPGNVPGTSADLLDVNNRKWAMIEGGKKIYDDTDLEAKQRQLQRVEELKRLFIDLLEDDTAP